MLLTLLLLPALPGGAQQLTISNNVLGFACAYGAELYASADLRYWERMRVFTNTTALPTNGEARFFMARSRMRPVQIVAILDTNQIIRGYADKLLTNIVATGEGGTYKGWTEYSLGATPRGRTNDVWCFRFQAMPGNTNVLLTLHDVDGFSLVTNIVINPTTPSTYQFRPPSGARPRAPGSSPSPPVTPGIQAPAKAGKPVVLRSLNEWSNTVSSAKSASSSFDTGEWIVATHSVDYQYYSRSLNDRLSITTYNGAASTGTENVSYDVADLYYRLSQGTGITITKECEAAWTSSTNWLMYQTLDAGPCWFPTVRWYSELPEIASLDDSQNTFPAGYKAERMKRTATSKAQVYVGCWGTTNARVQVGLSLYAMTNRIGDEILSYDPTPNIATFPGIGEAGPDGWITTTVADGSWLDVTPTIPGFGKWFTYWIGFRRLD